MKIYPLDYMAWMDPIEAYGPDRSLSQDLIFVLSA